MQACEKQCIGFIIIVCCFYLVTCCDIDVLAAMRMSVNYQLITGKFVFSSIARHGPHSRRYAVYCSR